MKDRAAAERACKDPNPIIDGRKANVNLAYLGAKPRGNIQLAGNFLFVFCSNWLKRCVKKLQPEIVLLAYHIRISYNPILSATPDPTVSGSFSPFF